ncbi:hypothetical protein FRAHR75_1620001 [Frankia sp. Hr75.2]|nr:hypothetical protein FRAHR75_1620001 [Frankia sp. Hr75.2]
MTDIEAGASSPKPWFRERINPVDLKVDVPHTARMYDYSTTWVVRTTFPPTGRRLSRRSRCFRTAGSLPGRTVRSCTG